MLFVMILTLSACSNEENSDYAVLEPQDTLGDTYTEQEQTNVVETQETQNEDELVPINDTFIGEGPYLRYIVTIEDGYITYNTAINRLDNRLVVYGTVILIDVEDRQYFEVDRDYLWEAIRDYVRFKWLKKYKGD